MPSLAVWCALCAAACAPGPKSPPPPPPPPTGHSALGDASKWTLFDLAALPAFDRAQGHTALRFLATAFDRRFVYLVPSQDWPSQPQRLPLVRHDTTRGDQFTDPGSWESFDLEAVPGAATRYCTAVFDSRYLYLRAINVDRPLPLLRFDATAATMADLNAWARYDDPSTESALPWGCGATFDGRAIYLGRIVSGGLRALRYDRSSFGDAAAWQAFDPRGHRPLYSDGLAYDGRYVYFAPSYGQLARVDTQGSFAGAGSWEVFDIEALFPGLAIGSFEGAVFDGRYLTFVAVQTVRFDTARPLSDRDAWSMIDLAPLVGETWYAGGVFDGAYVYFVPRQEARQGSGLIVRHLAAARFDDFAAWETFDVAQLAWDASGFGGAAFDGRYLYLVPYDHTKVARFDARYPPAIPSSYTGSFY